MHVSIYYIIIGGNQHAGLAAYVPCNKTTVISSEMSLNVNDNNAMGMAVVNGPGLASLLRLELCCATAW